MSTYRIFHIDGFSLIEWALNKTLDKGLSFVNKSDSETVDKRQRLAKVSFMIIWFQFDTNPNM